jgi:hypothetical protein
VGCCYSLVKPFQCNLSSFSICSKPTNFYNLDVIISVGYRVKSHRGIHFRKWATALIKEYLIKVILKMGLYFDFAVFGLIDDEWGVAIH